ncbi:diguanylate cyclase [Demequina sp. NBRC 110055]|uniref:GGDEF domain-containing protein n=1 Tax=Demequina sp. NBRC 110055 TaxID=1570344 RepID=UPI000A03AC7C|nr:GGDEF domain-containing protein [Demequina sp. NBRC 110055]
MNVAGERRGWRRPASLTVAAVMVSAVLALQLVGALYMAWRASSDTRDASADVASIVADAYAQRAGVLARPAGQSAEDVASAVASGALTFADEDALLAAVHGFVAAHPPFQTMAVFTPEHEVLGVLRTPEGLRVETLAADGESRAWLVDESLAPLDSLESPPIPPGPPVWLDAARAAVGEGPVWQHVIRDDGSSQAVVSVAVPRSTDGATVVTVVALASEALNAELDNGTGGAAASAFLLDSQRAVVAGPTEADAFHDVTLVADGSGTAVGFGDGEVVVERPLGVEGAPDWIVHVQVAPAEIVPGIAALPRQMLVYTGMVVLIAGAVTFGLWLLRRPLLQTVVRARTDQLTGLANRHELNRRGQTMLDAASKRPSDIAVVAIDLDHFKSVNDEMGHDAGDTVLRACGHALTLHSGERDLVARLGGDEFAVVRWLELGANPDAIVETLRAQVERDIRALVPDASRVGVSAGFTTAALAGSYRIGDLLTAADEALMGGRRDGKGTTYAAPATNPLLAEGATLDA